MELLATSVPGQVKSFIQFVIVNVFITCSLELLRVVRVIKAYVRSKIAPDLTEKDRTSVYLGLEPLTEAEEMDYSFDLCGNCTLFHDCAGLFMYCTYYEFCDDDSFHPFAVLVTYQKIFYSKSPNNEPNLFLFLSATTRRLRSYHSSLSKKEL